MVCYGGAIWYAFDSLGVMAGVWTIVIVGVVSLISLLFSLRAKTWNRFALKQNIDSTSMPQPEQELSVGVVGVAISRLAPMGKVSIAGKVYEAKSEGDYIDQKHSVEVVGFENFSVIVRKID